MCFLFSSLARSILQNQGGGTRADVFCSVGCEEARKKRKTDGGCCYAFSFYVEASEASFFSSSVGRRWLFGAFRWRWFFAGGPSGCFCVGVVVSCPGSSLKETERRNRRMRLPCVFYGDKGNSIRKPREKKRGENGDLLPLESFSLLSSCEDSNQERGRREGGGRWARERGGRGGKRREGRAAV